MTRFLGAVLGLTLTALVSTVPHSRAATPSPPARSAADSHVSPFACNTLALGPKERKRHFEELGPQLRGLRKRTRELPNGYEFEFESTPAHYALLQEWMLQERACCPFFDLDLRLDREGGPLWLRLTGRDGVKKFIESEFPPEWFR
jgi:hypothetical protein